MNSILIVEDEKAIAELIHLSLTQAGYLCEYVLDGKTGADRIEETDYDLILLDIMLPEIDGYELMEYIEPMGVPVIFITAKGSVRDRVKGLRMGADDYIVKPFEIPELVARVESVLRRYHKGDALIAVGDVTIDTASHCVLKNGIQVDLTPKEYDLLVLLARNRNTALYRDTLFERVWGGEMADGTRTLDLHIQRLRKKLSWQDRIKTVYKVGYRLEA